MQTLATTTSLCALLGVMSVANDVRAATDPEKILDAVDDLYRSKSAHGRMVMTVKTAHWSRTMELEFWSKGEERSLVRILAPKKEKGTATLKVETNIWNYLPKIKRVIKVPSSMMGGSWMGSHFTNNDLVRDRRMAEDFTFQVTFEGEREGRTIIEVTCTPRPDAPVVWGKVVVEVDKDFVPTRILYYDEDLALARTMTFSEIKLYDGRKVATYSKVEPANKPGEFTEVRYQEMTFDLALDDGLFTLRSLER